MEKNIQIFDNQQFGKIRIQVVNEQVLFCAIDIAKALGYVNPNDAVLTHCKTGNIAKCYIPHENGIGGVNVNFISESDVYRLIMHSRLPNAEKFQDWVCDEVLPSIRKHGMYATSETIDAIISDPEFGIKLLLNLKEERQKRLEAESVIEKQTPKVEFYDAVVGSNDVIEIGAVAKLLNLPNVGRNRLFQILRNKKVLMRDNKPYQRYVDSGYFRIVESKFQKLSGEICINIKTVVYQKGIDFIRKIATY